MKIGIGVINFISFVSQYNTLFITDPDITDEIWLCAIVNFYRC
jgi:hypothetical protein